MNRYDGADGNGNGMVDGGDYTVWKNHYGQTVTPTPGSGGGSFVDTAAASQDLNQPATSPVVDHDLTLIEPTVFATNVPNGFSISENVSLQRGRGILADAPLIRDRALLEWVEERPPVHSNASGDEDIMSLGNETGSSRDASDAVLGSLVLSLDNREQLLLVLAI